MYDLYNNNLHINLSNLHIKYENKYKFRNTLLQNTILKIITINNSILISGHKLWNNLPNSINNIKNKNQ